MNNDKMPNSRQTRKVLAFVLFCLVIVGGIVYMKRTTTSGDTLEADPTDTDSGHAVAVPDTTAAPGTLPAEVDTVVPSVLPDTLLGRDKRPPYEAGYEDGYSTGCDDGAAKQEHAGYDESNNFNTPADREAYVRGYREGYAKGYEDGMSGKQFNI